MDLTIVGEYYPKNKVKNSSSNMICNKISITNAKRLERWQSLLYIEHWAIECEPIDEMQVIDDLKGTIPGHEFVGITINFRSLTGIIYHTRPLQDDDIVHELLHVRFPDWSEEKVNDWTSIITSQSDINIRSLKIV